jgi:hypothetical protein
MGKHVNRPVTTLAAGPVSAVDLVPNLALIAVTLRS